MAVLVNTDNPDKFLEAIDEWENITFNNINYLIKVVSLDLFSQVIKDTPVRSGRARNNWVFSYGTAPTYKDVGPTTYEALRGPKGARATPKDIFDKTGNKAINKVRNGLRRAPTMIKKKEGVINYYLTNKVPYIRRLEYGMPPYMPGPNVLNGRSRQAPNGMARKNTQKFAHYNFTKLGKRKGKI